MNHLFNCKAFVHARRGLSAVSMIFKNNQKKIRNTTLAIACSFMGLLPVTGATAREYSEIEAFIQHVKATNSFVTVSNIWQTDNNFDKSAMMEKVEKAQALTIDYDQVALLMKQNKTAISLELPGIGSGNYTIELAQFSFLPNNFEVHLKGANNSDELFNYTPGLYYRGVVKGIAGSVAAFSFFNNEVYGIFSIPGEGNYVLVPNTMVGKYYDKNPHYVLYNDNDLKIKSLAPKCGADQLPDIQRSAARTTTTPANNVYNNCTEVRVFETGDYALYRTKGLNATNVTNYLTALFNNQSTLYRNEGIPIILKYVVVNTASDIYQGITTANSSLFLNAFGDATQNTLHGCDVAMLVSTALNGGYGALGGVAWLRSICATYDITNSYGPYGFCDMDNSLVVNFPTFSWDVEVITHEMGHIVGSPHTHACCWGPTRNKAIDGCYTLEGSCTNPGNPTAAVGGTIMSYCHLTSSGINFANGFGTQPGDTVRYWLRKKFSATCGVHYNPNVALTTANRTVLANRECTDIASGDTTTYYWKDNNTADQGDDTLVLVVLKHGNDIGNLNTSGFSVSSSTLSGYGGGTGQIITFPASTPGTSTSNIGMRRYWKLNATTAPVTPVEVLFPFLKADTSDVSGGVGTSTLLSSYSMYKVNGAFNPDPSAGFSGALSSSFSIYTYDPVPSTSKWSLSTNGTTYFAHMKMTNLTGGGSGFFAVGGATSNGINDMRSAGIFIYPNPADKFLNIEKNDVNVSNIQICDVQGKILLAMTPDKNKPIVSIPVENLASGLYFLQLQTDRGFFTNKVVIMK